MNSKKKVMYKLNPVIFWPILIIMVAIIALSFINQNGFAFGGICGIKCRSNQL